MAIAEHIGGSVEGFAEKMNEKQKSWDVRTHILLHPMVWMEKMKAVSIIQQPRIFALIMAYAIKKCNICPYYGRLEIILSRISQGKKHYSVHNTNAFLDMETGVISEKQDLQEMPDIVMSAQSDRTSDYLSWLFWDADGRK